MSIKTRIDIAKKILVLLMAIVISVPGILGAHLGVAYAATGDEVAPAAESDAVKTDKGDASTDKEDASKDVSKDVSNEGSAQTKEKDKGAEDQSKKSSGDSAKEESASVSKSFDMKKKVDGVTVHVTAPKGTFPDGVSLSVKPVSGNTLNRVESVVDDERPEDTNVARSYTFDIKVIDAEGSEVQPADGKQVSVSFTADEVDNDNLDTRVYHITGGGSVGKSLDAEALDVTAKGDTATVKTDGFSYYTVEFTYGEKTYVIDGGGDDIKLQDLLKEIDLVGEIENAEVSNDGLIYVGRDVGDGEWYLTSLKPFDTLEWLRVTLDGIEYEITLTDSYVPGTSDAASGTFASDAPIATITLNKDVLLGTPETDIKLEDVVLRNGTTAIRWNGDEIIAEDVVFRNVNNSSGSGASATTVGSFTLRYVNAAVLSDGTKKDLLISYTVQVMPRIDYANYETRNIVLLSPNGKGDGSSSASGTPTQSPAFLTIANSRGAIRYDTTYKIDGLSTNETFVFTARGYNLFNRNGADSSNNDNRILYWNSNRHWGEQIGITGGINSESGVYIPSNLLSGTSIESFGGVSDAHVLYANDAAATAGGTVSDNTYRSGEVTVADASGLTARIQSYFAWGGTRTNSYTLPDGVTHNFTSSSGYYGKIDLWTDGLTDVSGTNGTKLYGGRYVNGVVDEKRTYDVAYGKDVTYKMTPEAGYIIDKLYIDGKKIDKTSTEYANFSVVYAADGFTPLYYTYKFDGDTQAGDLNDPGFDPRSGKGGSAHTIHVTWQPTATLDFTKNWNDESNLFKVRPATLPITLKQDGIEYRSAVASKSKELYYDSILTNNQSIPSSQPYNLTGGSTDAKWQYKWNGQTKYQMLPMYSDYDEKTNSGTLYKYTVEETLTDTAKKYYEERDPHTISKTDTDVTQTFKANNEKPNGFTESGLQDGTLRDIDYTIDNDLKYAELLIEKEVIGGSTDKGSFNFITQLKNSDIQATSFDGFTGSGGVFTKKTNGLAGDSFIKDDKHATVSTKVLAATDYKVVEQEQVNWVETSKSKEKSGKSYDSPIFGFRNVNTDELYVYKNGSFYQKDGKTAATLPNDPPADRYFDDAGFEIVANSSYTSGYAYKSDSKEVPQTALTNMVTISYFGPAVLDAATNNLVYKTSKNGDNGVTKADDIIVAKPVHRAWFQNRELEDLTIEKEVSGNQASRDKYFKISIELNNAQDAKRVTLDMTKADTDFNGAAGIVGNAATVYGAGTMNTANGKDDVTSDVLFAADDYEVVDGSKNAGEVRLAGNAAQEIDISGGSASFDIYLQHGQKVVLKGVPCDASYTITEVEEDYKPSVEVSGDDKTGESLKDVDDVQKGRNAGMAIALSGKKTVSDSNLTKDATVTFTNTRDGTVPTEVRTPWILGGLLMIMAAICWFVYRKRRMASDEKEDYAPHH